MVKSSMGNVEVKGNVAQVFAELEQVIRVIYDGIVESIEDETEARRMIYKVVENAFIPEDERVSKADKSRKILDLIGQLVDEIEGDEDDEEDL